MTRVPRGLLAGVVLLVLVIVGGTVGYMAVEGLSLVDAIYLTVITISTVGFAEPEGGFSTAGRLLTIIVILGGVGSALYTATVGLEIAFEMLIGGERRARRMVRDISKLSDHVIVAGFGRIGRNVWHELERLDTAAVIIDDRPDRAEAAVAAGALTIQGDATQNEVLVEAGISRARALIACVRADADNLVIVLSAKSMRPELLVIARATEAENESKLLLAGADRVVAPQVVGAHRLAVLVSRPHVADFIDLVVAGQVVEFTVEQIDIDPSSPLAGVSLRDADIRGRAGALVLGVQGSDGRLTLNPDPGWVMDAGCVLVSLGTPGQLAAMRSLAAGQEPRPVA